MKTLVLFAVALLNATVALAQQAVVVEFYHVDPIGSVRAVTDTNGTLVRRHDYFPFGEDNGVSGNDSRRFSGKERDSETSFHYFHARYYAASSGRFLTLDPLLVSEKATLDPQQWNRYAYTRNNPFRFVDPDGQDPVPTAWQMQHGSDGFIRVLVPIAKGVFRFWQENINLPAGRLTPEGESHWRAQIVQPSNNEESWFMDLTDLAILGSPLLRLGSSQRGNFLSSAEKGTGNFGLGSATTSEAMSLGKSWVGEGFRVASDGTTLISKDGLRQFRPPSFKPKLGKSQANFEKRSNPKGRWESNGHLDIFPE